MNSSTIKISHWNVRGLTYQKSTHLFNLANLEGIDILFISETWHTTATTFLTTNPPANWKTGKISKIIKTWSNTRQHGGLALFINDRLTSFSPTFYSGEYWIAMKIFGGVHAAIYFPPSMKDDLIDNSLQTILEIGPIQSLVGDFNARLGEFAKDLKCFPYQRAKNIQSFGYRNNLSWTEMTQIVPPDHIQHLFIGRNVISSQEKRHSNTLSDHPILTYNLRFPPIQRQNPNMVPTENSCNRQFYMKFLDNNITIDAMQNVLKPIWESLPSFAEVTTLGKTWVFEDPDGFYENGLQLVSEMNNSITSAILTVSENFLGSYEVSQKKNSPTDSSDFLHRSGQGSSSLRIYKRSLRSTGDAENIIISRVKEKSTEEDCLDFFKNMYSHREGMMNEHLPTSRNPPERQELIKSWLDESIFNEPGFEIKDIQTAIRHYPTAKARGIDGISPLLLKKLDSDGSISTALLLLFNTCLIFGQTPSSWNNALITTIPKDLLDASTVDKRRPISVLVMLRRIFEKTYLKKMETNLLLGPTIDYPLYKGQAGFRRNYSTYSNALAVHEAILRGYHQVAFIDLKQAYDQVDVEHLLKKLKEKDISFRFRNLVRSLYTKGIGSIIVNGSISNPFEKHSGLMQGGLWSPLLFSLYIDDLGNSFDDNEGQLTCPLKMFADDISILRPGKELSRQFREDISSIEQWCSTNSMAMQPKKSAVLNSIVDIANTPISLEDNSILPVVESYKYLGFPFTKQGIDLVEILKNGILKGTDALIKARLKGSTWPQWMKFHIYRSFIRSRWEYGAPLIFQALVSNPTKKLQHSFSQLEELDDDCFRWILGGQRDSKVESSARNLFGASTLKDRFEDLHTLFTDHLQIISSGETELNSVLDSIAQEIIPPLPSLLSRILRNKRYRAYCKQVTQYTLNPSHWTIDGVIVRRHAETVGLPPPPVSLKRHVRLHRQVEYRKSSAMMSLIKDSCRTGKGIGMDYSLFIPIASIRAFAIRWRLNRFGHSLKCPTHLQAFSRSCIHNCNFLLDCPDIQDTSWNHFWTSNLEYEVTANEKQASCYTILDDLLNEKQWLTFAKTLIFVFKKIWNPQFQGRNPRTVDDIQKIIENIEVELTPWLTDLKTQPRDFSLVSMRTSFSFIPVASASSSRSLQFCDNG